MKNVVCPLCSKQENTECFSERNHDLLACNNCGLFFINPYGSNVHEKVSNYDYEDLKILDAGKHHVSSKSYYKNKYLSYVSKECDSAKSILDVGCGTAALLDLLHSEKPDLKRVGIELNSERAAFAKKIANCEIFQTPIEEFTYETKFDVITMINVLSHIPSIDNLFISIRNLLAKDGKFILKVGEMRVGVKKDAIFDWGIPDHLHFLGMDTIDFICKKYGFKIVHHERQPLSIDLFSFNRWITPGRSTSRTLLKRVIALTPFALFVLRKLYDIRHGKNIYSSFIVISPVESKSE